MARRVFKHVIPVLIPIFLAILFASPALAQDEARKSEIFEDEGLRAESRGDYEAALEAFEKALTESVREAGKAPDARARARNLARSEFYLEKVGRLTGKTSRFKKTGEFLEGFTIETVGPSLMAWIEWNRARTLVAEGRTEEARMLMGDLGFLTDFWIAGSFDNERGGGFGTAYPPESGIDLDAKMKGKERDVTWRRVMMEPLFGMVDLDAVLRPNDQCLAYALAWFKCPDDRDAAVRIGSDESAKVWINGTLALARDGQRTCGFDQDVVGVRLRKGWNRLLVKVGDQTGPWGFRVRFTTPGGLPLSDLEIGNTREEGALAEAAIASAGPVEPAAKIEVDDGARGVLTRLAKDEAAGARDLLHLGYLHLRRSYEDKNLHLAEKILEKALELEPDNPFIAGHLGVAAKREVQSAVEKEENKRRHALEKAIKLDRGYAEAYYLLAHYYTYSLPVYAKAEANLERCLEVNWNFLDARLLEIDLLRRRGERTEANVKLKELLKEDTFATMTPFILRTADHARGKHDAAGARKAIARALETDFLLRGARDRLVDVLTAAGEPEAALGVYDERVRLDPFDLNARIRKAILLEGLGRLTEAAETALEALAICPENDSLLNQIGRLYYKLGEKDQTLALWKEALRVNPKVAQLRRYVEFVDPDSRPYEDAFTVDLEPLIEKAKAFENTENNPWIKVFDQQVDKVNPDGTSSTFNRLVVRILNDQGVRQFDRYGARFSPSDQAIHWKVARVIRPDGSTEEGRIVNGRYADLPRLSIGDFVLVEYRIDQLRQSFFGDYYGQSFFFGDWVPCLESQFIVIAPDEKDLFFHTRNLELEPEVAVDPEGKTKIFTFRLNPTPKVRSEPNMPSPREVFPQVNVSNYRSWDDFAKWYWNLIKNQFQMNDEMRAKVTELTADKETRFEKIRAVYDFVVTDIRYDASWEFGVHGYKPYDASAIYSRKFGDCKDKAILTTTLLGEIGIQAYPVLIYADQSRWEEDLTLPMVNHFNHAISYVPDVDGTGRGMFLDGTAQYHSIDAIPGMDRGARVLIVKPDGGEILQVPWNPADLNLSRQTVEAEISADGSAKVKAGLELGGDFSVMIRGAFSNEAQRSMRLNMLLGRLFGQVKLEDFSFSDLKDLSVTTATIDMDVSVTKFAEKTPRGFELKTNFGGGELSGLTAAAERRFDIVLGPPSTSVVSGLYRLPEGFVVKHVPDDVTIEAPFGSVVCKYEEIEGAVRFSRTLSFTVNRIPFASYERLREFVNAWDVAARERIVIDKE